MKQVRVLAVLAVFLVLATAQLAEAVSNAAVLYLRIAAGARAAGMGEAFVSIADDASATYWNPAGLGNAPIAGTMITRPLPPGSGEIINALTFQGTSGRTETWVISGNQLMRFEGDAWQSGNDYMTSSDQTLFDFLKTIVKTEDTATLKGMAAQVIAANGQITPAEVDSFIAQARGCIPEGYAAKADLLNGLEKLKSGYDGCLLSTPQFRDLQNKLAQARADGTASAEELDRITFSLDRAVMRFLPSHLIVPYTTGITGTLTCLGSGGRYLWVGTDDGLYRLGGRTWARFSTADSLPSNAIVTMASYNEQLFIGTDKGLIRYFQGAFTTFPNLPAERVEAVSAVSTDLAFAVIGGILYRYDAGEWSDSYKYTVRIDDSLDKLVARLAVYHTTAEYDYLRNRIIELNRRAAAAPAAQADPDKTPPPVTPPGDSTQVVVSDSGAVPAVPTVASDDISRWLSEGKEIRLPLSPRLRFAATALCYDYSKTLWVGTTSGLLSFDGERWNIYGYAKHTVPAADSTGGQAGQTAEEIARSSVPGGDSAKVALLAANINDFNELNGQPVAPGQSVYVYSANTGSRIRSLGMIFGELHVGTDFGLLKRTENGWQVVDVERLNRRQSVAGYDHDGRAYYVATDGLTLETKGQREAVLMHSPWLPTLNLDMYYEFLSYVQHIRGVGSFGASIIFLTYGAIEFTDETGVVIGEGHPFEFTFALSYGSSLSSSLKWGMTGKFIHSRLSEQGAGLERGEGIASAFAVDVGILYKITDRLQFGSALTNLGPNITYIDAAQSDPLPRNLGVGLSYKIINSTYNKLTVQTEANKLLTNLHKGIGRELEYAIRHVGAEYWYANLIALRAGYVYDKEGQVKHLTFGAGLELGGARLDVAYVPSMVDSPLDNTPRYSFTLKF